MIKFFRHIRQRMIKENRVSKYMLYAIGEIVLVVIGILIALSINTWNKGRHDLQLQNALFHDLREDLLIQQEFIANQLMYEELFIAQVDSARGFTKGLIDISQLQALLLKLTARHTFVANKATISKLASSGQIGLIRNSELENSIIRYYQLSDYTTMVNNNNNLFIVDMQFGPFVSDNAMGFGCNENNELDDELVLDREKRYLLKIKLRQREVIALGSIERFLKLQAATEDILQLIDNELEKES